jgi:hypothetical protein
MTRTSLVLTALATALVGTLSAMPAQAQRVFVAAQGSDTNPCTFAAPCRTFQHAHDTVAARGEIDVLDPAGYGPLKITKAISIQGHGFSGISVPQGIDGIVVNAPATDFVSLNGLLIEGNGEGDLGILFQTGRGLIVENCVIRNMRLTGMELISTAATPQTLSVSNSYFTENGSHGIIIATLSTGPVTAAIERTAFFGNVEALSVQGASGTGTLDVAVTDSVAGNSGGVGLGFFVGSSAGHSVSSLVLTRVTVVGNSVGIRGGPNATLRLAQSTVTGNDTGYDVQPGGTILSYGDNYLEANRANGATLGTATRQ